MIALDTNVLVRVVTRDDEEQLAAALAIMDSPSLYVAKTVLLELEWVLRYSYDLDRPTIAETLLKLLGLRRLRVEDRKAVVRAREGYAAGMDFADALHLASSGSATSFATFDRKLARKARETGTRPSVEWLGAVRGFE